MSHASMDSRSGAARAPEDENTNDGRVVPGPGGIELSVVMPCLNEAETVGICIEKALGFMERNDVVGEVIIADNGSTDGSCDVARAAGARVVDVPRKGYGAALLGGIHAAAGKFVVMGDCDDSYDFSKLELFLERLRAGDELVMGNRFRGGIAPGAMPKLHKYFGNPFLTMSGRVLFGSPVGDFQCGLRGFQRDAMMKVGLCVEQFEFASEMVVKSTLHGLKISEVPTTLSPDGRSRAPHLRSFRDGWRNLRFLLMHSPRWLFMIPGGLLVAFGLLVFGLVLPGPRRLLGVNFDLHSLVVGAGALVLGTQMCTFGLLAKQFGANQGLLPQGERLARVRRFWRLERAIGIGLALGACGFVAMIYAVASWRAAGLGDLEYGRTMRIVVPAVTSMVVGAQLTLSGFMGGILDLQRRD